MVSVLFKISGSWNIAQVEQVDRTKDKAHLIKKKKRKKDKASISADRDCYDSITA
jgi:hypothetical protein